MENEKGPIDVKTSGLTFQKAGIRTYMTIWLSLLFLTGVTVTAAYLNLGRISIIIVLFIAATKSTLVLLYFMHLRYEKRLLIKLLIPGSIVLLAVFIILTFSDVISR